MRGIKQIQDELNSACYQRRVALDKCNVLAAEHYLLQTKHLLKELEDTERFWDTVTFAYYVGAGI